MARHGIDRAVLDVAAAIGGARHIEWIADARSDGWGGVVLQMDAGMTGFNVMMFAEVVHLCPAKAACPPRGDSRPTDGEARSEGAPGLRQVAMLDRVMSK